MDGGRKVRVTVRQGKWGNDCGKGCGHATGGRDEVIGQWGAWLVQRSCKGCGRQVGSAVLG